MLSNYLMTNTYLMRPNPILDLDSYKLSHPGLYPRDTTGLSSYIEARIKDKKIVPVGLSMWIKKHLMTPFTQLDIDEAAAFAPKSGLPFHKDIYQYILKEYGGYFPVEIYGIPEGTVVDSLTPIVVAECTDPVAYAVASTLETSMQRGVWYPTTIASNDRQNYKILKKYYDKYSDNPGMIEFSLHDFGGRGVSCEEQAQIGGMAHLVYFMGSDTVSGIRAANHYYNSEMSGFGVVATEHSIQCSYGPEHQEEYLRNVLDQHAKPGAIVSIVLDGYDVYREANLLCTKFREQIKESGAKIVFRPDSGDPLEVIPRLLDMQQEAFGYTKNSKGMMVINNVGIIQGDGIDTQAMDDIMDQSVCGNGYAPESAVYGSGGALLQKVNRDTYKFAQKTSARKVREKSWSDKGTGTWEDVYKDPITDPGKRSKAGRMITPQMIKFYEPGKLLVDEKLDEVRKRAKSDLD